MWMSSDALRSLAGLVMILAVVTPADAEEHAGTPGCIDETLGYLEAHLLTHPEATAVDLYKLLHQAMAGPAHAVSDEEEARVALEREAADLEIGEAAEPLCEHLGGEPRMVRVHLRPYLAAGGDLQALAAAFVASASTPEDVSGRLARALEAAIARLAVDRPQLASDLAKLQAELEAAGYPAVHHSRAFREAYRPAYRVLRTDLSSCPEG